MAGGIATHRPPLVLLIASQLRADVLSAYGDEQTPTPKLDLLAQRATTFERHYTPSPQGVPARASLWTGLYPRQHGAIINGWFPDERPFAAVKPGLALLPRRLADVGYRVVHVGVQHVRLADGPAALPGVEIIGPTGAGEHHDELARRGLTLGDMSAFREPVLDFENGKPVVAAATGVRIGTFPLREELFYDWVLADRMIEVIQGHQARHDKRPLALLGNFWLPHPPLWSPKAWATLIDPHHVKLPATVGRWYTGQPALQLANVPGHIGAHVTMNQWQHIWAAYLGMTALLDRCIGRVLAALDHAAMFEGALIAFTSDHGEMLGSHGLFGKMCCYEDAVRVPMLLKLPQQSKPRRVGELTDHLDLCATLLDAAGAGAIPDSPGMSLLPHAQGVATGHARLHDAVFASYDGNAGRGFAQRMVRTATHKLILNAGDKPELYDLIDDPRETINLAGRDGVRHVELELRHVLVAWMHRVGDGLTDRAFQPAV